MAQQQQQNPLQAQIPSLARNIYQKAFNDAASRYGSRENVPQEVVEDIKQNPSTSTHVGQAKHGAAIGAVSAAATSSCATAKSAVTHARKGRNVGLSD